jgi:hypothetical protein
MLRPQLLRSLRWIGTFVLLVMLQSVARADPPGASLGLVVFGDELPREQLRSALQRELGRDVTLLVDRPSTSLPYVTVTWRRERSELAVTYDEPGRGTLVRVIAARATGSEAVEDATVLATSLVRNEADELLPTPAPRPRVETPTAMETSAPSPPPVTPTKPAEGLLQRDDVLACASLFFPAATNWNHPHATTRFSLNLIYGLVGALDNGVQLGTVNVIVGKAGVASGDMSGVQLGGLANYASGHANGLQFAVATNGARRGLEGGQLSLGANISGDRVDGFQVGSLNVAGDLLGMQLGLVNVSKKMTGLTVGLINVADEATGIPIGVVSVTRSGGVHPLVWGSSASSASGGVKFAADHTYTIAAAQYTFVGPIASQTSLPQSEPIHFAGRGYVGAAFYLGGHVPVQRAFIDFDGGFSALAATEAVWVPGPYGLERYWQVLLEPRVRGMGGYSFARHLSLFAGASLAVRLHYLGRWVEEAVSTVPEVFAGAQF